MAVIQHSVCAVRTHGCQTTFEDNESFRELVHSRRYKSVHYQVGRGTGTVVGRDNDRVHVMTG
jgi:hypothetical protein